MRVFDCQRPIIAFASVIAGKDVFFIVRDKPRWIGGVSAWRMLAFGHAGAACLWILY